MATELEFVKKGRGLDVATFNLTDCFSSKYDVYRVFVRSEGASTTGYVTIKLLDNTDSVVASTNNYAYVVKRAYDTFFENKATNNASFCQYGYDGDKGVACELTFYNPANTSRYTHASFNGSGHTSSSQGIGFTGIAMHQNTTEITGLQFLHSNPDANYVDVEVYGVVQ